MNTSNPITSDITRTLLNRVGVRTLTDTPIPRSQTRPIRHNIHIDRPLSHSTQHISEIRLHGTPKGSDELVRPPRNVRGLGDLAKRQRARILTTVLHHLRPLPQGDGGVAISLQPLHPRRLPHPRYNRTSGSRDTTHAHPTLPRHKRGLIARHLSIRHPRILRPYHERKQRGRLGITLPHNEILPIPPPLHLTMTRGNFGPPPRLIHHYKLLSPREAGGLGSVIPNSLTGERISRAKGSMNLCHIHPLLNHLLIHPHLSLSTILSNLNPRFEGRKNNFLQAQHIPYIPYLRLHTGNHDLLSNPNYQRHKPTPRTPLLHFSASLRARSPRLTITPSLRPRPITRDVSPIPRHLQVGRNIP